MDTLPILDIWTRLDAMDSNGTNCVKDCLNMEEHSRIKPDQPVQPFLKKFSEIPDYISQADPQVVTDHPVHADLLVGAGVIREHDAHRLPPLLALQQHSVPSEELQFVHLSLPRAFRI